MHAFMRRHPSVSVTEPQVFQTWPGLYGLALVFTDVAPRTCVSIRETQVHATLALAAAKSADADSRRAWNTATAEPSGGRTEVRNGLEAANPSQRERIRRVEKLRETLPPKAGHASATAPASSKRPLFRSPPLDAEMDP